jgi:predicted deacylase
LLRAIDEEAAMKVGTAEAAKGKIARGEVVLGYYPDGAPITSAVLIASGQRSGPTLWVQSCLHGPEIGGVLGIQRFLKKLDPVTLSGAIVCLMATNPLGFRGYHRLTPQDGFNLNRVFPGKPDGHFSEQLAHRILELALATGDAMLDLHSGGDWTITCHYTLFHNDGSAAGKDSERLAYCTGAPNIWNSLEPFLAGTAFANFSKRGKPALIMESGGGARATEEDIDRFAAAIRGVGCGLGLLDGEPPRHARYRLGGDAYHLKSTRGGLWHTLVQPGDEVTQGQALGTIVDLWGDVVETPRCPLGHAWVGSIRRPYMPIYSGDQVTELVTLKGYDEKR